MTDPRGSVIAIANSAGTVTSKNKYDDYGAPAAGNLGRFQFTGQMWLAEAGLYHYKARAYHPELGRFLQTDPIGYGDGLNMYAYVGNDPVNGIDPSGLCTGSRLGGACGRAGDGASPVYTIGRIDFGNGNIRNVIEDARYVRFPTGLHAQPNTVDFNDLPVNDLGSWDKALAIFISQKYYETQFLAEAAAVAAIVKASTEDGVEYSTIVFKFSARAVNDEYIYSFTDPNPGEPGNVDIQGAMPFGAQALSFFHTHLISSIPDDGVADRDSLLTSLGIPAYVVGLDGKACHIRWKYDC